MKRNIFSCLFFCLFHFITLAQVNQFVTFNAANTLEFANTGNAFRCIGVGDSMYWAGTQYKGLFKYDTIIKVWYQSTQIPNVFINDIKCDSVGGVWVAQSGTSGQTGGASNLAGGINYFPTQYDYTMQFFSVPGTTTGGGLSSRNIRSLYIDTLYKNRFAYSPLPRVWAAEATYITSGNTMAGGFCIGINSTPNYFVPRKQKLEIPPYGNGTPSCDAVAGDKNEVWVAVRQNFGKSQILRYHPSISLLEGAYRGAYDNSTVPQLPAGFRAQAMFVDGERRRWIGLQSGGIVMMQGTSWTSINMPQILPAGTAINNNAITEDDFGNVYFGTTNGLLQYDGGIPTDTLSYTRLTTADGLPSNNITGLGYDKRLSRMVVSSDAGITFWTIDYKIKVTPQWDYSFPDRVGKPKGLAADGVSRIYLKIENGRDDLPPIRKVVISLKDYITTDSSIRGKLKKATITDRYSDEASTDNGIIDSLQTPNSVTPTGSRIFNFWYVSPQDFSNDSLGPYANSSSRTERIQVIVTYENDTKDTTIYKLRIVRPPLVLVHGLADGPHTWNNFTYGGAIPYIGSSLFKYVHALTIDGRGAFIDNAKLLVSGEYGRPGDFPNTLQGNIDNMRTLGYAANQVDYIGHSMGGVVIRDAMNRLPQYFYTGGDKKYSNYNAGFTHKVITINTPHNSSPVADAVAEFIPDLPKNVNIGLALAYFEFPEFQHPFDFIEPADKTLDGVLSTKMQPTKAVSDLQITDSRGGRNLAQSTGKFHLIASNVELFSNQTTTTMAEFFPSVKYVEGFIETILKKKYVPKVVKDKLRPFLTAAQVTCSALFWEWYCKNKGFPNYLSYSDLVVPMESEMARIPQSETSRYISRFVNSPGSFIDACHITILKRPDVGQKVFGLLNSKLSGPLFGNTIPANGDADPSSTLTERLIMRPTNITADDEGDSSVYDTAKIKIDLPAIGTDVFADSSMNVKFRVKDTANLSYVKIHFQLYDTFTLVKTKLQQTMPITVTPEFPGRQMIWALAAYNTPDSGMIYHIDSFSVSVKNNAAVAGFRIDDSDIVIKEGQPYYPPYQVLYNTSWVRLPVSDPLVSVSFEPGGIIQKIDSTGQFIAVQDGITSATFTYSGFSYTVLMEGVLSQSGCINQTIADGAFKNPAIWSKGVIPDVCDSVIIAHIVTLDTTVNFSSLRINAGKSLTLGSAGAFAKISNIDGSSMIDNYGIFNISNGNISIDGRIKHNAGSTFNMTGGNVTISGNKGFDDLGVLNGQSLFEATTGMTSFNFSGGTLQLNDPPYGAASQALNCPYDFGNNSTLILGANTSTLTSKNADGFGGLSFPNKIGKLIVNAGTRNGNRQFISKKPLTIKGSAEVRTGSGMVVQQPITVNQ